MIGLVEKRFAAYFRDQPETGMGYWAANARMKDGKVFKDVVIDSGYVTKVPGHQDIPFTEADIDHFVVTHEKWRD